MKSLAFKSIALLVLLGAVVVPSLTHAIPTAWTYAGICTSGDCADVPTVAGTISGDPTSFWPSDELNSYALFGDLTSWSFTIGSYAFSGTNAAGTYVLDASGNIVGGSMTFGSLLALDFLSIGKAAWSFVDTDCKFFVGCYKDVEASGSGGYTNATAVPEPGILYLIGSGLLALAWLPRRRRN